MKKTLAILPALLISQGVMSAAFENCPAEAYLTQGSTPKTYSVNLTTGDYRIVADDMGTNRSVNAVGFNPVDKFAYGWSYQHAKPVRIHSDMSLEVLDVANISSTNGFYVGDMHPRNGKLYVYRRGNNHGLFSINVDSTAAEYLTMEKIVDGKTLSLTIADMAISPSDGSAYAIDNRGRLYQFDLQSGRSQLLNETSERGGYGASYFDSDGNFYASRNRDGKIFKFAVDAGDYTPQLFAHGPSSSVNDGWRCALATVNNDTQTLADFGDAPASYGTYLEDNGARHGQSETSDLYLGSHVDSESDASAFPLSDDDNSDVDDDDGVQIATNLVEGRNAVAIVGASDKGFLNAWIDLNRNGSFESDEQILTDTEVGAGKQAIYMPIPQGIAEGESWARFRLSSTSGIGPDGGVSDGEVEDYPVTLIEQSTVVSYYPSASDWTTLAFEDNWPHEGDYDMNDLVIYMRTAIHRQDKQVTRVDLKAEVAAVGAAYHNGFAIRLPGIKRSMVDIERMELEVNGKPTEFQSLEEGRDEAILIVTYNLWDFVDGGPLCLFYRTEEGCGSGIQMNFRASVPLLEPVDAELEGVLDPFLFATPGAWHGGHFVSAPGRSYEIHLKNQAPTEAFDKSLFEQEGDDASSPEDGMYFQTEKGMPWALEIGTRWDYPIEYNDVSHAYGKFQEFVESNGEQSAYWYNPEYSTAEFIFTH